MPRNPSLRSLGLSRRLSLAVLGIALALEIPALSDAVGQNKAQAGTQGGKQVPVKKPKPSGPRPSVFSAERLLRQGKAKAAARMLEQLCKKRPTLAAAWQLRGYAHWIAAESDAARAALTRASKIPAVRAYSLYLLALLDAQEGRWDDCAQHLERAVSVGHRHVRSILREPRLAPLWKRDGGAALRARLSKFAVFAPSTKVIHEWSGEAAFDQFGWVADRAGDVDRDGVQDVIVGANLVRIAGRVAGRIYVYSGRSGKLLFAKDGKPVDLLGYAVGSAGDLDGDGHDEFLAGAPASPGFGNGRVYVWSGKDGKLLLTLEGEADGDRFGIEAGGCGDYDGDGTPDILVGASGSDVSGRDAGAVSIWSGKTGKRLRLIRGESAGHGFGRAADARFEKGRGLLVVGAPGAGPTKKGRAYVYRDHAVDPFKKLEADATGASLAGMFVAIHGDIDGDAVDDVYVSDWGNNAGSPASGRVYVLSGKTGKTIRRWTGTNGEGLGIGNALAGDVDGDGAGDLILGAWSNSAVAPKAGAAYLRSGKTGKLLREIRCLSAEDYFGFDATGIGDVNGDGKTDFLLTSAWSPVRGPKCGRVFVIAGQ